MALTVKPKVLLVTVAKLLLLSMMTLPEPLAMLKVLSALLEMFSVV